MRLIDADETYKVLTDYYHIKTPLQQSALKEAIERVPTIDAEPVRHGRWIWSEDAPLEDGQTEYDREAWYQCSECDAYDLRLKDSHADYCWSCGAKMDLDEVEE